MIVIFFAITQVTRVNAFRRWSDDPLEPDFIDIRNDCSSEACLALFPKKRNGEIEQVDEKPRQVLTPYHIMGRPWQVSCPCETQYDILDLGLDSYPRYLATARCTPKTCYNKFTPCRLIHYKVHILRQRDTGVESDRSEEQQQYVEQIALPESLRLKWEMKPIKIAVACIAADGKKN
ncbi:prothoracicotropic hormone isoform X2 [Venturia canescens]|uniref:prothoracicotropic hormone isoform X2 n=1 Tax=Venturia canescens TaxID=32260 RepID=UPI001C9C3FFB|nr:prothoracicotropic hormone-like isoform X2 [Venturia canescens]